MSTQARSVPGQGVRRGKKLIIVRHFLPFILIATASENIPEGLSGHLPKEEEEGARLWALEQQLTYCCTQRTSWAHLSSPRPSEPGSSPLYWRVPGMGRAEAGPGLEGGQAPLTLRSLWNATHILKSQTLAWGRRRSAGTLRPPPSPGLQVLLGVGSVGYWPPAPPL